MTKPILSPDEEATSLIKQHRMANGLTLMQLANKVGSRKAYMWQLENKTSPQPTVQMAIKISRALDVPIETLFPVEGQASEQTATLAKLRAGTHVVVPVEATEAKINSACLSYRHDFGLLDAPSKTQVRSQSKEWLHAWITAAQKGKR